MIGCPRVLRVSGPSDHGALAEAAQILRRGGLVAFPTETVYGLGADATNPDAIARLNAVKGRPPGKPYSLHLHAIEQVDTLAAEIPPAARRLMRHFWPGPLTLVLPGRGGGRVGLRLPDHAVARAFLAACGIPVAAPSANRADEPPPTDANSVLAALDGAVDCLLDAGPTACGRESTVVSVSGSQVQVLREGAIAAQAILAAARGA